MTDARSFLVLWQTAEAESWVGRTPSGSVGSHSKGLVKGDRIFISAYDDLELYLLGAMTVSALNVKRTGRYGGKPFAPGKTVAGPFQMLPLGGLKWRLRFENTGSPKLSNSKSLLWQVRSRRQLTSASAELLLGVLAEQRSLEPRIKRQFALEGRQLMQMVPIRERDPRVRAAALRAFVLLRQSVENAVERSLDSDARKMAERDGITYHEAYFRVLENHPERYEEATKQQKNTFRGTQFAGEKRGRNRK